MSSSSFKYFIFLIVVVFFQALLYGSCVSQKDNITKHACDKEFQALKDCIRQAVSFLVDWPGSLFFLCLISLDIILVFKPQTQLSWQDSQMGAQKCRFREWGDKKESPHFFYATHSSAYLSRVCFSSNFVKHVKHKQLMTGFKGYCEFSSPKTLKCSLNWSHREQLGSNKKWLLSWEVYHHDFKQLQKNL